MSDEEEFILRHWGIAPREEDNTSPWKFKSELVTTLHNPGIPESIEELLQSSSTEEGGVSIRITQEGKPLRTTFRDGLESERARALMHTNAGSVLGIVVVLPGASRSRVSQSAPECDFNYLDRSKEQEEAREGLRRACRRWRKDGPHA